MLINEVCKNTNITKKSIEYYTEQGLISPAVAENGYRDFGEDDVERLKKIAILRKLGISTDDIRTVLADETGKSLQRLAVQKRLYVQREQAKRAVLDELSCGRSYSAISGDMKAIEDSASITEKLLESFPGYYGWFLCLHFASFLNAPIVTDKQQSAFERIKLFLDQIPALNFPQDVQDYLNDAAKNIGTEQITAMIENTKKSIENPEDFWLNNKEMVDHYLSYKQSDEYKSSLACKLQSLLHEFNFASGYYDIFIPAMKELSASYAEYCGQLEIASEKLLAQYPEIAKNEKS